MPTPPSDLVGKTIKRVDIGRTHIEMEFTDSTYLEISADVVREVNGSETPIVDGWYRGADLDHGKAGE